MMKSGVKVIPIDEQPASGFASICSSCKSEQNFSVTGTDDTDMTEEDLLFFKKIIEETKPECVLCSGALQIKTYCPNG